MLRVYFKRRSQARKLKSRVCAGRSKRRSRSNKLASKI